MRVNLFAIALLTALSSAAIAGPKEEALQVLEKWTKAFTDSDVDAIVKPPVPMRGETPVSGNLEYR
jgi:hypothetical protein